MKGKEILTQYLFRFGGEKKKECEQHRSQNTDIGEKGTDKGRSLEK